MAHLMLLPGKVFPSVEDCFSLGQSWPYQPS